jgi:hypothetical protein
MLSSSQDRWLRWLCRVYGLMLWAYPPDFRGDYRREMLVVFRTGARDVMQREGSAALLPFMRHVSWDWLYTTLRERTTMTTSMPALRWVAALPLAILAAVAVMRLDGFILGFNVVPDHDFHRVAIWTNVGFFLMAAAFVGVGVSVVPGRKDSVARIALAVVVVLATWFVVMGAIRMAMTPVVCGVCALLGGVLAYLPWRLHARSQVLGN